MKLPQLKIYTTQLPSVGIVCNNQRLVLVENKEDDTLEFKYMTDQEYAWMLLQEQTKQPKDLT